MADIIKHSTNQFSENFETLVSQIKSIGEALQQDARVVISYSATNLRSYRLFYTLYPELRPTIANYLFERFGGETVESSPNNISSPTDSAVTDC